MARTVDHISGGRLILGIGAGWFQRDYDEYGYDFGTAGTGSPTWRRRCRGSAAGWAQLNPPPTRRHPDPRSAAAARRKTLRFTAEHADIWHGFGDAATSRARTPILDEHCARRRPRPGARSSARSASRQPPDQVADALVDAGVSAVHRRGRRAGLRPGSAPPVAAVARRAAVHGLACAGEGDPITIDSAGILPCRPALPARRFCWGRCAMPSGHASTSAAWSVPKGEPGADEEPLAAAVLRVRARSWAPCVSRVGSGNGIRAGGRPRRERRPRHAPTGGDRLHLTSIGTSVYCADLGNEC